MVLREKNNTLNISFKSEYTDVYNYVCSKDNKSGYIIKLIQEDMKLNNKETLKEEIKREVLEELMVFITGLKG